MPTGLDRFYTTLIKPHLRPAIARLNEWGVPHNEILQRVTKLALPHIKLVAWLALVMSPAPSVMVASAAFVFIFEPWVTKRFEVLHSWLAPQEGRPQTSLEAFASTFFNHRAPEITEIEIKLEKDPENQTFRHRLTELLREDNKLSASQQALFFGTSLIVAHLLPGPLLIPVAIIFGGLVGDHLYRAALRNDAAEEGAEPVYGYETLIQRCTKPVEEENSEAVEPPPIEWTFAHAWTLLSEHVNPLLQPIIHSCESNGIPLIQLVRKIYALAVPKVKCIACIAILTLAAPAVTLPYATALAASIWLIFDSLGGPLIPQLETGETYLEGCVHFFDNQKISFDRELAENRRIIELLEAQKGSNERAIAQFDRDAREAAGRQSTGGSYGEGIAAGRRKCEKQNTKIEEALTAFAARNTFIERQQPKAPTSIERQAAAFAVAYLAAKFIGHYPIYYGIVAVGGGVLIGNHVYHWATREDEWEIIE